MAPVPVTESMAESEIASEYEKNTGHAIVRAFEKVGYASVPAVLVANHGPFAWGPDPAAAAHNAVILEAVARMAYFTINIDPAAKPAGGRVARQALPEEARVQRVLRAGKGKEMMPAFAMFVVTQLVHLSGVDVVIIAFYFALVLAIGFYLRGRSNTGEDFFMAGREMTAWVAGLSFLSANLGALELMGWAGSAYQYGILATHWYWIGAIPAMLFLALVMMPFYYISKTHSVPGYLKLRFGEPSRALSAVSFAFMTVLMSGVNMFAMAKVMQIVLGWDINFSIWVSSLTVAIYVTLGGLRSAIFNEVLQFFLIWAGALLIPILGLYEAGGWTQSQNTNCGPIVGTVCPSLVRTGIVHFESHGHPLDRHCVRTGLRHFDGLLDHGFPGGAAHSRRQGHSQRRNGAHYRRRVQDAGADHRDPARTCWAWLYCR